ncbi:hypothetical protein TRFO_31817 [Tritrichomonas foetus]|uniref:Uncharacterized protein n=1 Tax=Tritrichomonas foetus TaxID=1144522 RepID=A0A1J4JV41_9EUKA|nr:hypothetical protein TRFO_31817 [Tritrichomonas foetus]|eukprot:OHT01388.1 hypothetical protein TRFO_31817 [Tritrichomonas foetus]
MFSPRATSVRHVFSPRRRCLHPTLTFDVPNGSSEFHDPIYLKDTFQKLHREIQKLRKEVGPLVSEYQFLQERIEFGDDDPSAKNEYSIKMTELNTEQNFINEEVSKARRFYSRATVEKFNQEIKLWRYELIEEKNELEKTEFKFKLLKKEFERRKSKKYVNEMKKEFDKVQEEINHRNIKLNDLRQENSNLTRKYTSLISEKEDLKDKMDYLRRQLQSIENDNAARKVNLSKIKRAIRNLQNQKCRNPSNNNNHNKCNQNPNYNVPSLNPNAGINENHINGHPKAVNAFRKTAIVKVQKNLSPGIIKPSKPFERTCKSPRRVYFALDPPPKMVDVNETREDDDNFISFS